MIVIEIREFRHGFQEFLIIKNFNLLINNYLNTNLKNLFLLHLEV